MLKKEPGDAGRWRIVRERPGTLLWGMFTAVVVTGGVIMIYAAGARERKLGADGGETILLASYSFLCGLAGYGIGIWKRRIRVEEELREVRETFARLEQGVRTIPRTR